MRKVPPAFSRGGRCSRRAKKTKRNPSMTRTTALTACEMGTRTGWRPSSAAKPQNAAAAYIPSASAAPKPIRRASANARPAARDRTMTAIGPASGIEPTNPNTSAARQTATTVTSRRRRKRRTNRRVARYIVERVELEPAKDARAREGQPRREHGLVRRAVDPRREHEREAFPQEAAERHHMTDEPTVGPPARLDRDPHARVERLLRVRRVVLERAQIAGGHQLARARERLALPAAYELIGPEHGEGDLRAGRRVRGHELGPRVIVDAPRAPAGQRDRRAEAPGVVPGQRRRIVDEHGRRRLGRRRRDRRRRRGRAASRREGKSGRARAGRHTRVSHSGWDESLPRTTSKKRAWIFFVTGPTVPSPIGRLSTSRTGVTSAAVPVKNTSSASQSWR